MSRRGASISRFQDDSCCRNGFPSAADQKAVNDVVIDGTSVANAGAMLASSSTRHNALLLLAAITSLPRPGLQRIFLRRHVASEVLHEVIPASTRDIRRIGSVAVVLVRQEQHVEVLV